MTIEAYLTSPTGAEDARALLSKGGKGKAQHQVPHQEHYWRCWSLAKDEDEAWSRVEYHDIDTQPVAVYFRPYGDRFIVTDLGEAVRALRLRTGCRASDASSRGVAVLPAAPFLLLGFAETHIHVDDGLAGKSGVLAADLPRAICALLLAAHRVASLLDEAAEVEPAVAAPLPARVPDQPPPAAERTDQPSVWDLVIADMTRPRWIRSGDGLVGIYRWLLAHLPRLASAAGSNDVLADMRERDRVGRARYGTPLQPFNGRKPLVDAYQEALDLVVYLRQHFCERGSR